MVREKGLEPSRLAAHAPKACVSTIPPLAHGLSAHTARNRYDYTSICIKRKQKLPLGSTVVERQRRVSVAFRLVHHNNSINGRR